MSNYFYANLGSSSVPSLSIYPVNKGDTNLYLRISGNYLLTPGSKLKAIIVPSGITILPDPVDSFSVDGLLTRMRSNKTYYDITYGLFSAVGGENNSDSNINFSFTDIKINDYYWENTPFNLHWLLQRGDYEIYGSVSGVYTLPHNIQNSEVSISGNLTTSGTMSYFIKWDTIYNETASGYGSSPTDGPYRFKVTYAHNSGVIISGLSDWVYYPANTMLSGIYFTLPYNDDRTSYNTPAIYNFYLSNVSADPTKPKPSDKIILIDHQKFTDSENFFKNLDEIAFTAPDVSRLKKVGTIKIDPGIINRKRLSIGINDISVKDNTYVKQGIYVSPYYPVDFNLYTLSLRSVEKIPEYQNLDPYKIIQYFIEINSKWEQISPINRGDELIGNILVPKIFVFDKGQSDNSQVKFIETGNVNNFRVKIVFDLTNLNESKFIPPEVFDYKCIIFDKDQLNEL